MAGLLLEVEFFLMSLSQTAISARDPSVHWGVNFRIVFNVHWSVMLFNDLKILFCIKYHCRLINELTASPPSHSFPISRVLTTHTNPKQHVVCDGHGYFQCADDIHMMDCSG